MAQWMESVQAARSYNPKTILGFLATVVGIAVVGCTAAGGALLVSGKVLWLVPLVFGFAGFLVVGVLVGVFVILLRDPSKLLLTHVSGTEYLNIQRGLVLGDSKSGEQLLPPRGDAANRRSPEQGDHGVESETDG